MLHAIFKITPAYKHKRNKNLSTTVLLAILLLITCRLSVSAQALLPEPDRTAEDFVIASVCIADPTDWRDDALGTSGHAFIRLQCPYYNLDFCFSYEGENVNDNLHKYLSGQTKMGMFAVTTAEYLKDYHKWNRSVHEYELHIPPEAELRLWEIMDNHLTNGISLTQDLNKYGCAITVVKYVKQALNGRQIKHTPNNELEKLTRREIGYRSLENYPWLRLTSMIFTDSRYDKDCPLDEKLIFPADLAKVWQNAKVTDQPLLTYKQDLVSGAPLDDKKPFFTPMLVAVLLMIITLAFSFSEYRIWDYVLIAMQAVVGIIMIYLWFAMDSYSISAYLLWILFCPLTLIFYKWKRYWQLPYAAVLLCWTIVIALLPHMIIDPALLVLAISYIIIFSKDFVKQFVRKHLHNSR